ncbi:hypothetical protein GYMLUDRAFT_59188 [Collybiopsis luxurians FD-317 M1]|uniref:Uncharacterized protein n=1 Tax=Collybiopsis luxurians FD-317 M1 TaxID=944289 RepID=A0A0D0BZF1_9AGAR|nr:hypothetical protein GYMLUDRAFT_59188 [Collybiopsis luxurians FD-317 M1]
MAPESALEQRLANNAHHGTGLHRGVMSILEDCLRRNNHFATLYNSAYERIQLLEEQSPDPVNTAYVKLHFEDRNDPRTYNLPTAEEVAVILPGPGEPTDHRDIILQLKQDL